MEEEPFTCPYFGISGITSRGDRCFKGLGTEFGNGFPAPHVQVFQSQL